MRYGWRIDPGPWRGLEAALAGRKWRRTFLEADYKANVPRSSGVYMICGSPSTVPVDGDALKEIYSVVYVGQSNNLRQRFSKHVRGYGEVRQALKTFRRLDYWFTGAVPQELNRLEQLLIDAFGPPANGKNVTATIGDPIPAGRQKGRR